MTVLCFGEVLWDCLPRGLFLGGAPLNVAYHLHCLGRQAVPVSAVGDDFLGREIRRRLTMLDLDDRHLATVPQETGTVLVELRHGKPSYRITDPAAWDAITVNADLLAEAEAADALVFGSLSCRHPANRQALAQLRTACPGISLFDVNLRRPYDDLDLVTEMARGATILKLNDEELPRLLGAEPSDLASGAADLALRLGAEAVLLTAGPKGAGCWQAGRWYWADAPWVEVRDTVGAGDSFSAAFLDGWLGGCSIAHGLDAAIALANHVVTCDGPTPPPPSTA